MKRAVIQIEDRKFTATIADTEKERQIGLSETDDLAAGEGMLFVFDKVDNITMNMVSMSFPLDMIFIDDEDTVIAVRQLRPGNYDTSVENVKYVLEVNAGEGAGLVGSKAEITEVTTGVIGAARNGAKFNLAEVFRRGGLFLK